MTKKESSLFAQEIDPFKQFGFVMLIMLLFVGMGSITSDNVKMPWISVIAMMLFFALANAVLSIPVNNLGNYWWKSILSFVALAVLGGGLAYSVSGVGINEAGSSRWLYVVVTIGYLVFISIIQLVKFLIFLAQRDDNSLRGE